ncbi:MAG: hypothetical protein IJC70_04635, partial [Firmicutes bacterium]|nr:hypothetical protein [Bacillota bacterium]
QAESPYQQDTKQQYQQQQSYQQAAPQYTQSSYAAEMPPAKGSIYEPISVMGYIGISLLMCIPIVGIVLALYWAFKSKKVNRRNFARAMLIMMVVAMIISLIFGFIIGAATRGVKELANQVQDISGYSINVEDEQQQAEGNSGKLAGLLGKKQQNDDPQNIAEDIPSPTADTQTGRSGKERAGNLVSSLIGGKDENTDDSNDILGKIGGLLGSDQNDGETTVELSSLEGLLGEEGSVDLSALSGMLGGSGNSNEDVTNRDIEELEQLSGLLGVEEGDGGLGDLLSGAIGINKEAEANNSGWPKSLRKYPGGTATAVASYRTEISNTSKDEMMNYISDLKKDGFAYRDFYDFGMSEDDMLGMNGWWATDGEIYLSLSYYDGIVTIDHTYELPDLSGLF